MTDLYQKAAEDIIEKYEMKEIDSFLEKNKAFEDAVKADKEFYEAKGMAQYMKTAVLDRLKLEGVKKVAVEASRDLYKKLGEIKPYEKKIIVSHYLQSKGVRDADQLLEGDEGSLEDAIKKWESENEH